MTMNKNKKLHTWRLLCLIIKYSWFASRIAFSSLIVCSVLLSILQISEIYIMQLLFDSAANLAAANVQFVDIVPVFIFTAALLILRPVIISVYDLSQGYFWRRSNGYLQYLFHEKVANLNFVDFEYSVTYDDMAKATLANDDAPAASRSLIQLITYFIPSCIYVSIYLFNIKPMLVLALVAIFTSIMISEIYRAKMAYSLENEVAQTKRQVNHYNECITSITFFKETRLLNGFNFFFRLYNDSIRKLNKQITKAEKKNMIRDIILNMINILGYLCVLGLLVYYMVEGAVSIGMFAAVFYSIDRLNGMIGSMISNIGSVYKSLALTSFLFNFLEKDIEKRSEESLSKICDIHVSGVSFKYPSAKEPSLKDLNFTIPKGKTLAIVGANGAGKTTLARILIGLYQPTSGKIVFGDKDISRFENRSMFESVSAVFQNYLRYKMSLQRNVQISDLHSDISIDEAINEAKIPMEKMTDGYNTMLAREFDGIELSGGEWQRVAIARGLYRVNDLIVLDEPTSAIDPIEEANVFRTFYNVAKEKTAVLITHRLGSTKIADIILVLNDGKIEEMGSHDELMKKRGLYYTMYNEQSKWYQR